MGYNGINFDRARMAPRSGIIDPSRMGPPQVAVPEGSMRQAIVQQSDAPQSVAEILSASNPAMASPDLMGAQTAAGRQRQIADMLMQGVQNQDNTSLAGGLSQLGQAFIARGATKKADKAEAEAQSVQSLLMQQALAGDRNAQAQIMPIADLLARDDRKERNTVEDNFAQQGLDLQGRSLDQNADHFGQTIGLQRDQFGHTVTQDGIQNDLTRQGLDLEAELGRGGLGVSRMNAETNRMGANTDAAALAAKTAAVPEGGFKLATSLQGAPDSVVNSVINDEDTRLTAAAGKTASARKLSTLADEFMKSSEGYGSLGGGPLADVGQAFSQKTAELKGFTAQMIPMFRSAGEGPMTDPDAKRYELAALSINKGRGANETARQVFKDFEADVAAYETFLRNYQEAQGYGSLREAERLWNEYKTANPIFDPETGERNQRPDIYKWMGRSGPSEFDDDASIPEGATVEDENGKRFRKQNGQLVPVMTF